MTIRFGIVGCGAIAEFLHAPAISGSGRCQVGALVDTNTDQLHKLSKLFPDAATATSIGDVANDIDAVLLATPPHARVSLTQSAMDHGLHVVCEKPLANTVAECHQLSALAQRYERLLAGFHQFRFWPSRMAVAKYLESVGANAKRVSVSQGSLYSWNSVSGYTVKRDLVPGGVVINAGIHPLDSLISWFGDPVDFEYWDDSCGGLESNAKMSMRFASGTKGEFRISRTCRLKNELRVEFDDHAMVVTNHNPNAYELQKIGREGRIESVESISCGEDVVGYMAAASSFYDNFADAVDGRADLVVDVIEATRVIDWIEACYCQKRMRSFPDKTPLPGFCW